MAGPNEQTASIAITRYNTDGSLDTGFDGDGKKTFNASDGVGNGLRGIHVRDDGKIVGVGAAGPNSIVVQLNPDGSFDSGFGGGDGVEVVQFGVFSSHLFASHLRDDGKLYVAGFDIDNGFSGYLLARLDVDGSLDTSFAGGDGVVVTHLSTITHDLAFGVATTSQDTSGKIVLTGVANSNDPTNITGDTRFGIVRYHADGTLDTSFDGDGIVTTPFGGSGGGDAARGLAIDTTGRIVTGGTATVTQPDGTRGLDFAVTRYLG